MTNRLYYDQPYLTQFDAEVIEAVPAADGCRVRLNQSSFYPTSGGQPFDTGTLGDVPVYDVTVEGGDVWHYVRGTLTLGQQVTGRIDWPRRFDHMQQHAGEHMIAGAIWRLYGGVTIGLHLGAEFSTIDVSMPGGETHLTPEQVAAVELEVNSAIWRDVPIRCWFPDEAELKALPLRKPPTVTEHVRIVAIGDSEMVACGGTHPSSAGQIGVIKIIDARPSKGKVRVAFVCGQRALRDYQTRFAASEAAAAQLSAKAAELPDAVANLNARLTETEHALSQARQKAALAMVPLLLDKAQHVGENRVIAAAIPDMDMDGARRLATELTAQPDVIALIALEDTNGCRLIFARGQSVTANMGALLKAACQQAGGKGGGKPDYAQGSSPSSDILPAALHILEGEGHV